MAFSVAYIIERLEEQGLFNIILPILLVFAIVYGILGKINLFGDNDKINGVIAFVFGMYVTMFTEFALFLTNMTAGGMTILVGLLFFLMIVGFGSSLSGGSPTSVLSDHRDALTIVLMLIGGIIFVNSGGLLVVGAYAIRIGFSDILSLTFLYVVYAVIKSLLGVGKADYNKIKKIEDRYKRILDQLDGLSDVDDDNDLAEKKRLENELKKLEKKLTSMGVSADQIGRMKEGQPIHYGRYGNNYGDPYGNPYSPYNRRDRRRLR